MSVSCTTGAFWTNIYSEIISKSSSCEGSCAFFKVGNLSNLTDLSTDRRGCQGSVLLKDPSVRQVCSETPFVIRLD